MTTPEHKIRALPHETLVVHGREDKVIPLSNALTLASLIPRAQLHVYPHCGHWTQIEWASSFNDMVGRFPRQRLKPEWSLHKPRPAFSFR
jgi:2-hydroxymuconate-semialdehyde hydrolase